MTIDHAAFEQAGADFYSAYISNGNAYCLDCFCGEVLQGDASKIEQFQQNMESDNITATEGLDDTINENTVQYEQSPGESIPLDGIECCNCGVELYSPMEEV